MSDPIFTLAQLDNRENNITLIRLFAAWGVLFSHSWALSGYGNDLSIIDQAFKLVMPFGLKLAGVGVSAFFFLSGFLIARSFERSSTLATFASARLFRIYPALWVNLLFCTFIVGALFSSLPFMSYVTHEKTLQFLSTNGVMWKVWFQLPPVGELFPNNPNSTGINGSLWTLPAEIRCYTYLAILGAIGLLRSRATVNVTAVALIAWPLLDPGSFLLFPEHHYRLVVFFAIGVVAYHNRDMLPFSVETLIGLIAICFFTYDTPLYNYAAVPTFGYCLMMLAFHPRISLPHIDRYGDYSYGLYLYAFPVQQALIATIPGIGPWTLFLSATLLTFPLAIFSWHCIEKPSTAIRDRLRKKTTVDQTKSSPDVMPN